MPSKFPANTTVMHNHGYLAAHEYAWKYAEWLHRYGLLTDDERGRIEQRILEWRLRDRKEQ